MRGEVVEITLTGGLADLGSGVVVRYAAGGITRTAVISGSADLTDLRPGQTVPLLVDVRDPDSVRPAVDPDGGARAIRWRSATLIGAAAIAAVAAAVVAVSVIRRRRLLARNPWVVVPARIVDVPTARARGRRRYLLLDDPTSDLVTAEAVGVRSIVDGMEPDVWVAGGGDRFLIASPGGAPVLTVRRVRAPRA